MATARGFIGTDEKSFATEIALDSSDDHFIYFAARTSAIAPLNLAK
jgi:hypothetical protein